MPVLTRPWHGAGPTFCTGTVDHPFETHVYSRSTAAQLATRVRSLLGATDRFALRHAAEELGVAEGDLREIVTYETVYPSVSVLAAIVAYYGVDAGWLLTGQYSPSTHRADEELGESPKSRVRRYLADDIVETGE